MSIKTYALTTVQRLADFIGEGTIASGSTDETILENIINSTTEYVERYTGRRFKQTSYTNEEFDGEAVGIFLLDNYPIDTTQTFTLQYRNSLDDEDDWETVDSEEYFIDSNAGIVKAASGRKFLTGRNRYRVTYTAGYDFDNSSTFLSDTAAGDVEYAMWKLGAAAWNRRKGSSGVKSEQVGDYQVIYTREVFSTKEIKEILDGYKRNTFYAPITPSNT